MSIITSLLDLQEQVNRLHSKVDAWQGNELDSEKRSLNEELNVSWKKYLSATNQNICLRKFKSDSSPTKDGMLETLNSFSQIINSRLAELIKQSSLEQEDHIQVTSENPDLELKQTISTYINDIYNNVLSKMQSDNNSGNDHLIQNYIDETALKVVNNLASAEKTSKGYLDLLYQKTFKKANGILELESNEKSPIQQENFTAEINNSSSQLTHKRSDFMPNLATKDVFTQSNTTEMTGTDAPLYDREDNANKEIKEKDHIEYIAQKLPANQEPKHDSQALVKFIDWGKIKVLVEKLSGTLTNKPETKQKQIAKFTKDGQQYTLSQDKDSGIITLSAQNSSFKQFAETLKTLVRAKIEAQPDKAVTITFSNVGEASKADYISALNELKALGRGDCNVIIKKSQSCANEVFDEALRSVEESTKKQDNLPFKKQSEQTTQEKIPENPTP